MSSCDFYMEKLSQLSCLCYEQFTNNIVHIWRSNMKSMVCSVKDFHEGILCCEINYWLSNLNMLVDDMAGCT